MTIVFIVTALGNVADVVNDVTRLGQEITPHQQGSCVPQPACDIFNYDEQRCTDLSHCQWQPGGIYLNDYLCQSLVYNHRLLYISWL